MKRAIALTYLLTVSLVAGAQAEEKPTLERGKSFIEAPAIGEGLCLSNLFQSQMVLQRDKPIAIWGWATAGESVTVSFGGQEAKATAAEDRSWKVTLPAMPANAKPQELLVKGKDKALTLQDILLGDVWVLGGQSNMEFDLAKIDNGQLEIVSANFPQIRHLTVPQLDGADHRKGFPRHYKWSSWSSRHFRQGYWDVCTPETVRLLSGIGYVFARRIHMAVQVPIGVIDASRGGTTVETWTPDGVLRSIDTPEVKALLASWDKKVAEFDPQKDLEDRIKKHHDRVERMKKAGRTVPPNRKAPTEPRPGPAMDQNRPGNCYASQIAPLTGLSVKGAIWHQGFNNAFQPHGHIPYYQIFPKMIKAWRTAFGNPEMPFGIISLCTAGNPQDLKNYLSMMADEGTYIRSVQYKTFVDLKAAGDKAIGFASSFDQRRSWYHPQIKVPVGERIAKWALATQYDKKLKWEPAAVVAMKAEDGKLLVKTSAHLGPYNNGPMLGFAIAGADGKFQPAQAEYLVTGKDSRGRPRQDRSTLVLSSPLVPEPRHYRYAWGRNPLANLKTGTIPFATQRSDSWTLADQYESYLGKKPAEGTMDRSERGALNKALKEADLQRRLAEARALLDEQVLILLMQDEAKEETQGTGK